MAVLMVISLPVACRTGESVQVSSIIDGDTIRISGNTSVRYIGIDAPEIGEPYYYQARDYNAGLLRWKNITLQADSTDKDVYGRLLRYLFADDVLVNAELVKQGYALVYAREKFPDNRYYQIFKSALDDAAKLGKGIWSQKSHPKLVYKDDYYLPAFISK